MVLLCCEVFALLFQVSKWVFRCVVQGAVRVVHGIIRKCVVQSGVAVLSEGMFCCADFNGGQPK